MTDRPAFLSFARTGKGKAGALIAWLRRAAGDAGSPRRRCAAEELRTAAGRDAPPSPRAAHDPDAMEKSDSRFDPFAELVSSLEQLHCYKRDENEFENTSVRIPPRYFVSGVVGHERALPPAKPTQLRRTEAHAEAPIRGAPRKIKSPFGFVSIFNFFYSLLIRDQAPNTNSVKASLDAMERHIRATAALAPSLRNARDVYGAKALSCRDLIQQYRKDARGTGDRGLPDARRLADETLELEALFILSLFDDAASPRGLSLSRHPARLWSNHFVFFGRAAYKFRNYYENECDADACDECSYQYFMDMTLGDFLNIAVSISHGVTSTPFVNYQRCSTPDLFQRVYWKTPGERRPPPTVHIPTIKQRLHVLGGKPATGRGANRATQIAAAAVARDGRYARPYDRPAERRTDPRSVVIDMKRAKEQVAQRARNTDPRAQNLQSDPEDLLRRLLRYADTLQAQLDSNPRFRALSGGPHHPSSGSDRKESF